MRTDPAHEQMNLLSAKCVFTDHPVIIAANIKYHPAAAVS